MRPSLYELKSADRPQWYANGDLVHRKFCDCGGYPFEVKACGHVGDCPCSKVIRVLCDRPGCGEGVVEDRDCDCDACCEEWREREQPFCCRDASCFDCQCDAAHERGVLESE